MNEPNFSEIDLTLAIQLQAQFEEELRVQREKEQEKVKSLQVTGHKWKPKYKDLPEPEQEKLSVSLVDPSWEQVDPNPNIYDLFLTFNHQFFWGRLLGVEVKWSPRMTLCAGVCSYEGRGGLCSVRLSVPLLKLRPRKDLIETLLHEMIHAYLFVTHNNTDHDGHGPQFHKHMYRINKLSGTQISVYHSFHNEVAVYRQHVWRCNGPCRARHPYFGLVKRSMNRPPSPNDLWWAQHVQTCGGTYTKIKEPEGYGAKKNKRKIENTSTRDIRSFFQVNGDKKPKTSQPALTNKENRAKSSDTSKSINGKSGLGGFHRSDGTGGSVSAIDVKSASNAKVHGFANSVKAKGKISSASKTTKIGSNSQVGGSGSTSNRVGGTKTLSSGSVGSKTIVTKSKKSTSTTPTKEESTSTGAHFIPFSGQGRSLGSAPSNHKRPKSRLLDQISSNGVEEIAVKERKPSDSRLQRPSTAETSPPNDTIIVGGSLEDLTTCPLCEAPLDSGEFEKHIADCLGDFDDDFTESRPANKSGDSTNKFNTSAPLDAKGSLKTPHIYKSEIHLDDSVTIISDDESSELPSAIQSTSRTDRTLPKEPLQSHSIVNPEASYSCPVCDKRFCEREINQHVNTHFE